MQTKPVESMIDTGFRWVTEHEEYTIGHSYHLCDENAVEQHTGFYDVWPCRKCVTTKRPRRITVSELNAPSVDKPEKTGVGSGSGTVKRAAGPTWWGKLNGEWVVYVSNRLNPKQGGTVQVTKKSGGTSTVVLGEQVATVANADAANDAEWFTLWKPATKTPSEKQVAFLSQLVETKRGVKPDEFINEMKAEGRWTSQSVSKAIDTLRQETPATSAPVATSEPANQIKPGMYVDSNGNIVKVQLSKAGRLYGKQWDDTSRTFEYKPGLVAPDLKPVDATVAKQFGDRTGMCMFCARELTAEKSIEHGYGPVCATKYGLPYDE